MTRSQPSLTGTIGRYEVIRRLGQGAMGRVMLAGDPVLSREVAIKLLRDDLGLNAEHRRQLFERMRQEARASARVSHPNIVALFDMGEDPTLGLYLVFEYVKGPTLKDEIARAGLAPSVVATLCCELGSALFTAHEASVLHRDIKPENVILSPTGAKIADFGIARLPESTLTRDGRLLGTPAYSSPESISHGTFSPASDQFSLAVTLYEAISRERAFPGDDAVAVATRITTEKAAPIASMVGLPDAVDWVLQRAMARDPSARFANCKDFGEALAEAILGAPRPEAARAPRPSTSLGHRARDRDGKPLRIILGAATLGAIVMALVLRATRSCEATPAWQGQPVTTDASGSPSGDLPRNPSKAGSVYVPMKRGRSDGITLPTKPKAGAPPRGD